MSEFVRRVRTQTLLESGLQSKSGNPYQKTCSTSESTPTSEPFIVNRFKTILCLYVIGKSTLAHYLASVIPSYQLMLLFILTVMLYIRYIHISSSRCRRRCNIRWRSNVFSSYCWFIHFLNIVLLHFILRFYRKTPHRYNVNTAYHLSYLPIRTRAYTHAHTRMFMCVSVVCDSVVCDSVVCIYLLVW